MKKAIIFLCMGIFIFTFGCKVSKDANSSDFTTISITSINVVVNKIGSGYQYSVKVFYNASGNGTGAALTQINLIFYSQNNLLGTADMGQDAFSNTQISPGTAGETKNLTITDNNHTIQADRIDVKITYDNGSSATAIFSKNIDTAKILPAINSFIAAKYTLEANEQTTIAWDVSNATAIKMNRNGTLFLNNLKATGLEVINPSDAGTGFVTYKLIAQNQDGEATKEIQLQVNLPNVEYRVKGQKAALITIHRGNSTLQFSDVTLPWSYWFNASSGDFLYVSAQNSNNSGCITVEIYKNKSLYQSAISCGYFVIATASGTY